MLTIIIKRYINYNSSVPEEWNMQWHVKYEIGKSSKHQTQLYHSSTPYQDLAMIHDVSHASYCTVRTYCNAQRTVRCCGITKYVIVRVLRCGVLNMPLYTPRRLHCNKKLSFHRSYAMHIQLCDPWVRHEFHRGIERPIRKTVYFQVPAQGLTYHHPSKEEMPRISNNKRCADSGVYDQEQVT